MNREYEIEHFGFTAEQSSLERKHFLQKIIRRELDDVVNKFNASNETTELLNKQKEEVFGNILESISEHIMAADNLDKKYFTIPDNVLLPPYFSHIKSYTEEDEEKLDSELEVLKSTFLENNVMLASLEIENSQYKEFSAFLEEEVKVQEQVQESLNSLDINNINNLVTKFNNLKNIL